MSSRSREVGTDDGRFHATWTSLQRLEWAARSAPGATRRLGARPLDAGLGAFFGTEGPHCLAVEKRGETWMVRDGVRSWLSDAPLLQEAAAACGRR